jgi:putative ABC transport system permease protein
LALGITALLLLTVARADLIASWRHNVPPDAPNRFIINIQPEQRASLQAYFAAQGMVVPQLEPMVRGRLVAINDVPVKPSLYEDERAQRLVEREFNLSWTATLPPGNSIVAGRWHGQASTAGGKGRQGEFSVERGLAETLHLVIGDQLTYDIAGVKLSGRITSLRRLDWDTMQVNFFVITSPGMLEGYPETYITSFYLPQGGERFITGLVRDFPNLTIIDVATLLRQLQATVDQLTRALQAVFAFALIAGFVVLYAALQASYDERQAETALLRALGARTRQLTGALLAEFAVLGGIAGMLAGIGAMAISFALAHFVFHLQLRPDPMVLVAGFLLGAVGVAVAGWIGTVRVLRQPALAILHSE